MSCLFQQVNEISLTLVCLYLFFILFFRNFFYTKVTAKIQKIRITLQINHRGETVD